VLWEVISLKHIYLIRHCKATGQEPNARLTIEGQEQADRLAEFLAERKIDYIVSSPYERAVSTIQPLARKLRLTIHKDDRLCERVLSATALDDWMEKLRASFVDPDMKLPGGESSREAMARGVRVIEQLFVRPEKNIAVVTHGNLMTLMLKYYDASYGFDEWRRLTNPDVYEMVMKDNGEKPEIHRIWK
jgi:2,3-bisphosphoglycerate-dependent phosphoglycerate mutase